MVQSKKKFIDILDDMFIGVSVDKAQNLLFDGSGEVLDIVEINKQAREKQGFVKLLQVKSEYFKAFKDDFINKINKKVGSNEELKNEFYDKLYDFFHRYFSPTGSVYYNQTPLFYNVFTKSYEKINSKDTELFYKTNMLYYVKSDKIYKEMSVTLDLERFVKFDISKIGEKTSNQKAEIIFEILKIESSALTLQAMHSQQGKKTKKDEIIKEANKNGFKIDESELDKALNAFNKQASFDFFINKNAKEFLNNELDLWIYQYLFSQTNSFEQKRIKQISDFKEIACELIDFIARFENELVKIWNKPRFVLNANYLVSIKTLLEKGFDIDKIYSHENFKEQKECWDKCELKSDDLLINESLAIDTKYFADLKNEIESLFSEDELNGILIKSENYQALNSILPRFKDKIDLIYIDPPFNTGSDFAYIDKFQDSTWLTLMSNRLEIAKNLLSDKGSFYLHLDHNADYYGRILLNDTFGKENFVNQIVWSYQGTGEPKTGYKNKHDILLFFANNLEKIYFNKNEALENISEFSKSKYNKQDENGNFKEIKHKDGKIYKQYLKDKMLSRAVWKDESNLDALIDKIIIDIIDTNSEIIEIPVINAQAAERINSDENLTQKPEALLARIIKASSDENSRILDYHLGSGTTCATALKLGRKFVGIEMGEHFYTVIIPRFIKALSGEQSGINSGKDKLSDYKGGGIVKYYEMESYEQILNTISIKKAPKKYIEYCQKYGFDDPFLFDSKLSEFFNDDLKLDFSKIYKNIDLKETILNATGAEVESIDFNTNEVRFKNAKTANLLEILKRHLVW